MINIREYDNMVQRAWEAAIAGEKHMAAAYLRAAARALGIEEEFRVVLGSG